MNDQNQTLPNPPPNTALAKRAAGPVDIVRSHLESPAFLYQVQMAMPRGEDGKRLIRGAITAMQKDTKIGECTQPSIFTSLLTCAQLGLSLDGREAHLVPFFSDGKMHCQLIPDYKGLVRLVLQSGNVSHVHADVVCEADEFDYDRGRVLKHRINLREPRGDVYAVYAFASFTGGGEKAEVMSREDVERIRARSKGKDGLPWRNDWNEMAKKTVFKRLSKWLPLSAAAQEAIAAADAADPVDVETQEVPDENPPPPPATVSGLPRREVRAARVSTVVDAPPSQAEAAPAPPPTIPRRPGRPPKAPAAPPPPEPAAEPEQPAPAAPAGPRAQLAAWIEENGITLEEINQASGDYQGWDPVPSFDKLTDEQVAFFVANGPAIADAIKGARV